MWKTFGQIIRIYGLYYFTLYCCWGGKEIRLKKINIS